MLNLRLTVPAVAVLAAALAAATATAGPSAVGAASVSCGTSATIGYIGPTTGPVASIGAELREWPLFYVSQWNATHKLQIKVVEGDDQFDPSQASTIAQQFASNSDILAVIGPGSSTEVFAAAPLFKRAGLAYLGADGDQLDADEREAGPLLPHRAARLRAGADDGRLHDEGR